MEFQGNTKIHEQKNNTMKIAIMQPYFFPYSGYFELISNTDTFVFLDDAQYTKRTWINRNKIEIRGKEFKFVVPVKKNHQKTKIMNIEIHNKSWVDNHIETLKHLYGKKIYKNKFLEYYETFKTYENLCDLLIDSLIETCRILNIKTNFYKSSTLNIKGFGEDRIINICKKFNASTYFNLPNGINYYNKINFSKNKIDLKFTQLTNKGFNSILHFIFNEHNYNF